ncbi:EAL domain-containing protein [Devosia sp. 2618]|uniref:putative bifunctional diguanylate cyclase/phosphodiesterase n=1 Tax=Devosia sp. 2618 TaxID=3156454 RepID=UPI003399B44C
MTDYTVARAILTSMTWLATAMAVGFGFWAISLFTYGDLLQRTHVAVYMGLTTIGCMLCLAHLKGASLSVGICVMVPFTLFFATIDQRMFAPIGVTIGLAVAVLVFVMLSNYRDFRELVASRSQMITKHMAMEQLSDENDRLANIDSLTGLLNRRSFDQQLAAALAQANAEGKRIAVARMDLDSFKSVNDIFGQMTGDRVLQEVAKRINSLRRPSTRVARLGADNYAMIVQEPTDEATLQACGDLLTRTMRSAFVFKQGTVHLSASAGVAASKPGDTAETLYDRADYVTGVAKRTSRGNAIIFSESHAHELSRVRRMENALLNADLDAEIYILFQPQFDIGLNRTTGYEVLARWRSPVLGEVSPVEFISMAERMGTISKITQTVVAKALRVAAKLPKPLRLSVNLSAHDLGSTTAIEAIAAQIEKIGKPCRVDFEITETAVMRDMNQANDGLLALLALGSRIALDDFGTGHSSLTHVQKLPLDRIKVDRSFVAEVTSDPTSRAIIKTTVDLCRNLGISCVFEGIETTEQLEALLGLGGTVMQGYLFGRPMSEELMFEHQAKEKAGTRKFGTAS